MPETLIVEDELLIAMNIKQVIESSPDNSCEVAGDVDSARQVVEEQEPELIVMDVKLGEDKNGIELADEFKKQYEPKVVACTAYSDPKTLEKIRSSSMDGYLQKPVSKADILQLIDVIFEDKKNSSMVDFGRGKLF